MTIYILMLLWYPVEGTWLESRHSVEGMGIHNSHDCSVPSAPAAHVNVLPSFVIRGHWKAHLTDPEVDREHSSLGSLALRHNQ